jgi:alpha-tubulin suppressor-like RCC1 family protein
MRRTTFAVLLPLATLLVAPTMAGAVPTSPPPPLDGPAATEVESAPPEAALAGVASISAGLTNTCAVLTNRQARCWGYGFYGANGTGTTSQFNAATTVRNRTDTGPLVNVRQVAVGGAHACALLTNGQVRCWGRGQHGQMGNGTTTETNLLPVVVGNATGSAPLGGVTQISADSDHTCARLQSGQVRCWGGNPDGQLGDGTEDVDRLRPVAVRSVAGAGKLTGITQVDAGEDQTCARTTSGQARCWGLNDIGMLGDGTEDNSLRPVVVRNRTDTRPLTGVQRVTTGGYHSCAVLTNRQARCWGSGTAGELGSGPPGSSSSLPVIVVNPSGSGPLTGVRAVDEGYSHTCALVGAGEARCWGDNFGGYLGIGTTGGGRLRPVRVRNPANTASLTGTAGLTTGTSHTCVRLTNGQARCWGEGQFGRLGSGTSDRPLPTRVDR